jgi:hypothetical protein
MRNFEAEFEEAFQSVPGALCVRDFYALQGDKKIPIRVVIYPPEMLRNLPVCRYTITGAGLAVDDIMGSGDRLSAILSTFYAVRTRLEELPCDVTWLGYPRMLDLPKQMPYAGFHFMRYCEELIDAEFEAAMADRRETKRLWGEAPNKRYEDCEGYRLFQERLRARSAPPAG